MSMLTTPEGEIVRDPDAGTIAEALDRLLALEETAEADLWLERADGWTLSVVPGGDIFWERQGDDSYYTLGPLDRDALLRLLHLLHQGKIDALQAEAWEEGL